MTPNEHADQARELMRQAGDGPFSNHRYDHLMPAARVHAILAGAPGTGSDYATAEQLVEQVLAGADPGHIPHRLRAAEVHALLAVNA